VPFGNTWTTPPRSRRTIVRNVMDSTSPPRAVHDGNVAHAHLVLQHQEEPADDVPDQVLGPEPDRQPEDAGAGKNQGDVQPELAQADDTHHGPDQHRGERLEKAHQRRHPLPGGPGDGLRRLPCLDEHRFQAMKRDPEKAHSNVARKEDQPDAEGGRGDECGGGQQKRENILHRDPSHGFFLPSGWICTADAGQSGRRPCPAYLGSLSQVGARRRRPRCARTRGRDRAGAGRQGCHERADTKRRKGGGGRGSYWGAGRSWPGTPRRRSKKPLSLRPSVLRVSPRICGSSTAPVTAR